MKKKGYILVVLMILSICICGCKKEENEKEALSEATMQIDKKMKQQEKFSDKLQVGEKIISVPCQLNTLLECEVVIVDEYINSKYLLDAKEQLEVSVSLADMQFTVDVTNESESTQRLGDCTVTGINNVTQKLIVFPGGIVAGESTFEDVTEKWGKAQNSDEDGATTEEGEDILCDYFYEECVAQKDLYAYESGGTRTGDAASTMVDMGGSIYSISYNRVTGNVYSIGASFGKKYGTEEYESLTYHFTGMDVSFDVLKDAYEVDEDDPLYYCVETINGTDYLIGVGAVNSSFNEEGNLLQNENEEKNIGKEEEQGQTKELNELEESFLCYGDYDFSEDYKVERDEEDWKTYSGESISDSIFFSVTAEIKKKTACEMVFYMHPVNRDDVITDEAVKYMRDMMTIARSSLEFK